MKKTLRTAGRSLTILLIVLGTYSCQQEELVESLEIQQDENFVNLDEATAIATILEFPLEHTAENASARANGVTSEFKDIENILEVPDKHGDPSFYIINYVDNGFIMISADNRTEPIKAFSATDKFSFNEDDYPSELVSWLIGTNEVIDQIRELNSEQTEAVAQLWDACPMQATITGTSQLIGDGCGGSQEAGGCQDTHVSYGPLLTTTWGQWNGYNNFAGNAGDCPTRPNTRPPTGCVATAMAQVMNYYEFPTNYAWASMPDNTGSTETAQLMRDVADAVNMNWGCDGSSANTKNETASSFVNDFGYTSANYADYNVSTVESQIRYNRPVILRGGRNNRKCFLFFCSNNYVDGHAWVCDGYRSFTFCETGSTYTYTYLHMNWGWSNAFNGYYAYNNWNPGDFTFNYKRGMVYNIRP